MSSIGKDLQKIRTHLGYSIQDIQHSTKIPVDTLESIENNQIFTRSQEGTTYIRSFIRSYGRAIKINDDLLVKALDQHSTGNYSNLLLQDYPELNPVPIKEPEPGPSEADFKPETENESLDEPASAENGTDSLESTSDDKKPEPEPELFSEIAEKEAAVSGETKKEAPADQVSVKTTGEEPSVKSVNWADVGKKMSSDNKQSSVWIVGIIILLIIASLAAYLLYENGYFSFTEDDQNEETLAEYQSAQGAISLDLNNSDEPSEDVLNSDENASELTDLNEELNLTVYAAYDRLNPVRVWSDLKPRLDPYWIDQGVAQIFEFRDTIRIRGAYSNILLFKNGHRITDFQDYYNEAENYIEITREYFSSDTKWSSGIDYDLPAGVSSPDSVIDRPSF